jgi:hypothetical protein
LETSAGGDKHDAADNNAGCPSSQFLGSNRNRQNPFITGRQMMHNIQQIQLQENCNIFYALQESVIVAIKHSRHPMHHNSQVRVITMCPDVVMLIKIRLLSFLDDTPTKMP